MKFRLTLFFVFFGLFLWTMPPTLAPYRDAGEMALSAYSLGVSHPPSYPLYILLGHVAELVPLGTPAYRLNILSALAGALALAVFCGALEAPLPALAGALLLGLNATFWGVSCVQEMYSLTLLMAAILLSLALRLRSSYSERAWYAFVFLYGLFLGNRTDLLLWAPGLLWLAAPRSLRPAWLAKSAAFVCLGLSIYLYLPLRSLQGPWLDWNHPATIWNFIGSLTRRGYGGTLDLLSKSYAPGSMFLPNLAVYGGHLWRNFSPLGLGLAGLGVFRSWREERGLGLVLLYAASGPLFLYMANMPPNPHAMAIVEPHYLLSDLICAFWAAEGLKALPMDWPFLPGALALGLALQPWLMGRWAQVDRRADLIGYDYVQDVLRSVPPRSVLVAKKDVQVFSLWYYQRVEGWRPDVYAVAQGLAHSPWYQASFQRFGMPVILGSLRSTEEWRKFLAVNPSVYATWDTELPDGLSVQAQGLAASLSGHLGSDPGPFLVRRGEYRYERRPDFFTADLVEAHALAWQRLASKMAAQEDLAGARKCLLAAEAMKWLMPEASALLGYVLFRSGHLVEAASAYELAVQVHEATLGLAQRYYALPDVQRSLRLAAADALINLGVVYERLKDPGKAESAYLKAIAYNPASAKPHFNLAVLYWGKDWGRVLSELEEALRLDPSSEASRYLALARAKARR